MRKVHYSTAKMFAVIVISALLMLITVIPSIVSASDNPDISGEGEVVECSHENLGDWQVEIAPTCQEPGLKVRRCISCTEIIDEEEIPEDSHRFTNYTVTEAPSCTKAGKKVASCDYGCGESDTVTVAATGHAPGEAVKENEKKATCTEDGSYEEVVYCTTCGEEVSRDTKTVAATGHASGEAVKENEKKATCTEDGSYEEVVYCKTCGEEVSRDTKTVAATGHTSGEAVKENEKKATCTKNGSYEEVVYCKTCGEVVSSDNKKIKKLGHEYGNYQYNNDATCVKDGTKTRTCKRCGHKNRVDARNTRLGHSFTSYHRNATCTGNEADVLVCSRCRMERPIEKSGTALGHDFGDYTSNGDGTLTAACSRCGAIKTVGGITASSNGETIIIPGDNIISPLAEPDPDKDNAIFVASYQDGHWLTGGTIDLSKTTLVNADGNSVVVVLLNDKFKKNWYYTVAFSDGTVSAAGCVADGKLKISVPRNAKGLGYMVMMGIPDSINVKDKDNNETTLADLMKSQYEALSEECMKQLAKDTQNEYITPGTADYNPDIYESFKEGYISLRMKGWTHEDAYNNIKNQFESQSANQNGSQCFMVMTRDMPGNHNWCNTDQYGCWVTAEDGGRDYIMFWSEESKNLILGKDKPAAIIQPDDQNLGRARAEEASIPQTSVEKAPENLPISPAEANNLPISPAEANNLPIFPAEDGVQSEKASAP